MELGENLGRVWQATTTTRRDREQLLRAWQAEAVLTVMRGEPVVRSEGGQLTKLWIDRRGRGCSIAA